MMIIIIIWITTVIVIELIFRTFVVVIIIHIITPIFFFFTRTIVPLLVSSTKIEFSQRLIWMRMYDASSPVRPIEPRWLRSIHIHLIGVPVFVENPGISIKEAIYLHSKVSCCGATPLPVDSNFEIISNCVRIRTNNDRVMISVVIILLPLFLSSLVGCLNVNERNAKFSRFPTSFRDIDLIERVNCEIKIRVGNWGFKVVPILFTF